MKKLFLLSFVLGLAFSLPVFGQFPQLERIKKQKERAIQAEKQREQDKKDEAAGKPSSRAKVAVMNVDVQIVLAGSEYKTFAEAKPKAVSRVKDGEPLWLYIKFNGKLGDYVRTIPSKEDPTKAKYVIYAEIGPQGDITTLNQYFLQFTKEDLAAQELKINLAPGLFGRNKSMPVFLETAGGGRPGVWNNEFRLTNSTTLPRGPNDNLAKSNVVFDFSGGLVEYPKMAEEYRSIILRGTTDSTKLPVAGTFFDETLKAEVLGKLQGEGITPAKFYFVGDEWSESASAATGMKQTRKVFTAYTYQKENNCFYGVAEITQVYETFTSSFGGASIALQNDLPLPCTNLN